VSDTTRHFLLCHRCSVCIFSDLVSGRCLVSSRNRVGMSVSMQLSFYDKRLNGEGIISVLNIGHIGRKNLSGMGYIGDIFQISDVKIRL
jgi:hypothetical protein